ncbi:unnamed protein product [Lathyrus sativus]|nr:unnamed protein product [Lathyrus sativus]
MMNLIGLSEMDSIGDYYTWSNKQSTGTIYSRIDKVLGNVAWFQNNHYKQLKILPPSVSDHAMLCVEEKVQIKANNRRFKFYNCIMDMIGFEDIVRASWNKPIGRILMYILWQKLQRLKPDLVKFDKSMSNVKQQVEKSRLDLEKAQNDLLQNRMDITIIDKVKTCIENVIRWNEVEESIFMQRAKFDWLRMGDGNNAYYYATIKTKHHNRSMSMLQNVDGEILMRSRIFIMK